MDAIAREKLFLEIHVQNLTQEPMWFERMCLEPSEGWQVDHGNMEDPNYEEIFSGSMALMQPQDMRQYVYTLSSTTVPLIQSTPVPGSSIPLGRLDISWRSSFGEPGRLLTSVNPFVSFHSCICLCLARCFRDAFPQLYSRSYPPPYQCTCSVGLRNPGLVRNAQLLRKQAPLEVQLVERPHLDLIHLR